MVEFPNEVIDLAREQVGAAREKTQNIKLQLEDAAVVKRVSNLTIPHLQYNIQQ